MAFPNSIGASIFSTICVYDGASSIASVDTEAEFKALFADDTDFVEIKNVRSMPSLGTPANIVKVPVFGQSTSSSIGAQADAPDLELELNLVPSEWAAGSALGDMVQDGVNKVFMVVYARSKPPSLEVTTAGIGAVPNAIIFFKGKIESFQHTAGLSDADTANVALSIDGPFYGFYTQNGS